MSWGHLVLFLICLVLVGLASTAQAAFGHLNATRLRHLMQQGASRSQAISEVVHTPGTFLSSVALLYLLSIGGATLVVFDFVGQASAELSLRAIMVVASVLLVLLAQTLGRGVATFRPEPVAALMYQPLRAIGALTFPLVRLVNLVADLALRRVLGGAYGDRFTTTEEDLRALVGAVQETEALEEEEREMIAGIFELSDRDVSQIMVPRVDVVGIDRARSVAEAVDLLVSSGHSRLPVFDGDLDRVEGLVHLRDLTEALRAGRSQAPVAELIRPVHVVPETKKIDELLHEFQTLHNHMAVVANEYGGSEGIVTIEDLLEEIVGEIRDEHDVEEELIQVSSDGREAVMDGRVSIHDANEALPLHLDDAQYDTIAGLVYERLDKVPSVGDVVRLDRAMVRVLSTKGRRVERVQVTLIDQGEAANGSG